MKNFATHCDTEVRFFETKDQAFNHVTQEILTCKQEAIDGIDEELVENIVVMEVIARAKKVNPNVHYSQMDYNLKEEKFVACCTKDSILHLFKSRDKFVDFMNEYSSSLGLVVAWIDDVKVES